MINMPTREIGSLYSVPLHYIFGMFYFCIPLLGQFVRSYSTHRIGNYNEKNRMEKDAQGGMEVVFLWEKSMSRSM